MTHTLCRNLCRLLLITLSTGYYLLANASNLPHWVTTPSTDTDAVIFGIGSGYTLESAKASALTDIAGKVDTRISSSSQLRQYQNQNTVQEEFVSEIDSIVSGIDLSSTQLTRSKQIQNLIWVEYALNIKQFSETQHKLLATLNTEVQRQMMIYHQKPLIARLPAYHDIKQNIDKALARILGLQVIAQDPMVDQSQYYNQLQRQLDKDKTDTKILITANTNGVHVKKKIATWLNQQGFTLIDVDKADATAPQHTLNLTGTLKTNCSSRQQFINEGHEVRLDCQISVVMPTATQTEEQIGGNHYTGIGRSYQSNKDALHIASNIIASQIKRKGLTEGLGLAAF